MSGEASSPVPVEAEDEVGEPRVDWEVPEVAAVVIVVAAGLLVLGGLATGIAAIAGAPASFGPGPGAAEVGSSIQLGAEWAGPLLAVALFGALGLCWWQVDAWSGAPSDADPAEVEGHVRRGRQVALWAGGALGLTLAGSIALFVGLLLANSQGGAVSSLVWSRDIYEAANVLAVAAIVLGGIWASRRVRAGTDGEIARTVD